MRKLLLCVVTLTFALPSWAGITYTAVTRTILGSKTHAGDMRVRAWVDGKQARMDFLESSLPELQSGTYLVTSDGGDTSFLVDPRTKTYERFDMQTMIGNMADLMRTLRNQMKVRFEEPKVVKLLERTGPAMNGLPTRHYRYRTSYRTVIQMAETETVVTIIEEDIWTTTAIKEPGVVALLNKRPSSGDDQLDRIIQKEMDKVPGFPLKHISSTRMETRNQTNESRTEMQVVELKTVPIKGSKFQVPKGYAELDPNAPDVQKALNKLHQQSSPDSE
ncbi:MAG: hypothetical protein ACXVZV_09450 [Terriglobales bacterium]